MEKTTDIEITFEVTKSIKKKLTVSEKELQALSGDGCGSEIVKKLMEEYNKWRSTAQALYGR